VNENDEGDNMNLEEDLPANIFEGDYFNTEPEDLEWPADEEGDGDIESEEEEVEAEGAVAEQERDWEPPVEAPSQSQHMDDDDMDIADAPSNDETIQQRALRHDAESPLHHQPHVVKFPLPSAGAAITGEESDSGLDDNTRQNAYHRYRQQLTSSDDSEDRVWAPFSSRIDYEVAHWAKTRGPGSTSFSDLLEIDGVSTRLQER
jgi:hypothetical protein